MGEVSTHVSQVKFILGADPAVRSVYALADQLV